MKTLLLSVLFLIPLSPVEEKKSAKLQGYDVLTTEGKEVVLRAKLERQGALGINPDLNGHEIVFLFEGKELGRSKTIDDGTASFHWSIPESKIREWEFQVSLPEASRYESQETFLRVFLRDQKRPSLVIDLDGTICASSELEVGMKEASEIEAIEGAAAALQELSKSFYLIYLTARDDALINKTREWLDLRGFPHAPLLVRDIKLWNLSAEKYKTNRLLELKKEFHLFAGVGDRKEDALAYMAAGMQAYLIGKPTEIPQGARKLVSWSEIGKLLKTE